MEFLGDVPISVIASADHPLARINGPISQPDLDQHIQLTLTDRTGKYRGVVMGSRSWSFIDQINRLDFVLKGFGWCTMPTHLARTHLDNGKLVELQLAIHSGRPLKFPLYTAYKTEQAPGPAAQWLLQDLKAGFAEWLRKNAAVTSNAPGIQIRVTVA